MSNVEVIVQNIPQHVRDALVGDARDRNISINEAAVQILAKAYKVKRPESTRPFRGESGSTQLVLVVPDELRTKLRVDAAEKGSPYKRLIIGFLADHYGVANAA